MKLLLCISYFILTVSCSPVDLNDEVESTIQYASLAVENLLGRQISRRHVRSIFSDMGGAFLIHSQNMLIENCKKNNQESVGQELETSFDDLKECIQKKLIFVTSKDEFISNMEYCSKDIIPKVKSCLKDDQKYFPDFILELMKSVVNLLYDDRDILRDHVAQCLPSLNNLDVLTNYLECLEDVAQKTNDTAEISHSKAEFCSKFLPTNYCFTDMLKDTCENSTKIDQFREDYINAMEKPCKS